MHTYVGEELSAAKRHFLATLSKGVDLLHEAYVESGRKRVVEYFVARQHSLAEEQCNCSELLAMDNEGLKEMVDVHSKVFEEQITQHQVAEEQAKQQCKGIRNALEVAQREAVNWKAKLSNYKAMVTG